VPTSGTETSALLPSVHRVASRLNRWLRGTHQRGQGAVNREYLGDDLDEVACRFTRRTSQHHGKLFSWVVPKPWRSISLSVE
jgi:hypothetical protein